MSNENKHPILSHISESGEARMVDVSNKSITTREAVASALVTMKPEILDALLDGSLPKGDAIATARIAGIQGAKKTSELVPLCHPLPLDWVRIDFERGDPGRLLIRCTARTTAKTGVEMEAMCGAMIAALTLYDMTKAADKSIVIGPVQLESKTGGKSGSFQRA